MTRHEMEEAVLNAKQLCTTLRGVQGLIGITEIVLNQTKLVDGLDERKATLEKELAELEHQRATKQERDERLHQDMIDRHKQEMDRLTEQKKAFQAKFNDLKSDYAKQKADLDALIDKDKEQHDIWMADCAAKQKVANESLMAVTTQIDAIKSRLGV
jgi:septal ring factor EnvC (AmiA/AmiB activator)